MTWYGVRVYFPNVFVGFVAFWFFFLAFGFLDRDAKGALAMLQSLRDSKTVAPDKLSYTLAIQVRGTASVSQQPSAVERACCSCRRRRRRPHIQLLFVPHDVAAHPESALIILPARNCRDIPGTRFSSGQLRGRQHGR